MKLYAGTSGYSYKEWKGNFYPETLPAKEMLRHYASRLPAVEINNTFYRMPRGSVLESWAEQVPESFRFSIKASRRITHLKRLKDTIDETEYLLKTTEALKDRLGVILFQLPPHFKKDVPRLQAFLDLLPLGTRAAFEFRHPTWFDEDVFQCLRGEGCALCVADSEGEAETKIVSTASWGYLRLRKTQYGERELARWVSELQGQKWKEVFVFFKHEEDGAGPAHAVRLLELARQG